MGRGPVSGRSAGSSAVWVVMMAAMMFPSVAPTVALYSRMTRTALADLAAALRGRLSRHVGGRRSARVRHRARRWCASPATCCAWDRAGRWVAGATLVVAAVYELTPLKDVCLGKCRSPLGFLLGSWRGGRLGALQMGAKNGAWCVGCCWALMASLFALGVMSIVWMAVVAGLIAFEKTRPVASRRDLRDGRDPARARRARARRARRDPRPHDPGDESDAADGDGLLAVGAFGDTVRAGAGRHPARVQGAGRRPGRPRLPAAVVLPRRDHLGGAAPRAVPAPVRLVLAADHLRPARQRHVGSDADGTPAGHGDAHG